MLEVDIDDSGTVDFFEFLCVARLISQGKGNAIPLQRLETALINREQLKTTLLPKFS